MGINGQLMASKGKPGSLLSHDQLRAAGLLMSGMDIEANSWEEARQRQYDYMGWGQYTPWNKSLSKVS
jgi:hypothetical protein